MIFMFYKGLLRHHAPWFEDRLLNLSDDSVDFIQNHPAIPVNDSSEDMEYFLSAIFEDPGRWFFFALQVVWLLIGGRREFPLESDRDFIALSAILRLATKYHSNRMRENAIKVFQRKFPAKLSDWDPLAEHRTFRWTCDPILVINLAREVSAFSLVPAAMAFLTNDASAGEVFGVQVHDGTRQRNSLHRLNAPEDIAGFALMKEYNHVSVVSLINFVREVGRHCIQPPEPEPGISGMSPVGTRRQPRASICSGLFHGLANSSALRLMREDPMGYRDFGIMVQQEGMSQNLHICRRCRSSLRNGYEDHRRSWWDGIPRILGLPAGGGSGNDYSHLDFGFWKFTDFFVCKEQYVRR
jgi:hypothetical protein